MVLQITTHTANASSLLEKNDREYLKDISTSMAFPKLQTNDK